MKKKIGKSAVLSAAVVSLLSFASCGGSKEKIIKIGFNIPLTGDSPKVGESAKYAGEIVKEEINSAGGLDVKGTKYKLEFIYVDNELKPDSAINAANKLIDIDKVLASVGPEGSGRASAPSRRCRPDRCPTKLQSARKPGRKGPGRSPPETDEAHYKYEFSAL